MTAVTRIAFASTVAVTIATVVLIIHFPLPTLAAICLVILIWWGIAVGRGRRLGVAVLGGTVAPILIPSLNTSLPTQTGMIVGLVWIVAFALLGTWKPMRSQTYALFIIVAVIGVLGAAISTPFQLNAQIVIYTIVLGFFASRLDVFEQRILLRGIVAVAIIEAIVCSAELLILGRPIFGTTSGIHPLFAGLMRAQGTLGHPLVAGLVILTGLALLGATVRRRGYRFLMGFALLLGILATGSSSIFIAAVLCLILNFLLSGNAFARTIKVISAIGLTIYLLVNQSIFEPITSDVSGANAVHRLNSMIAFPRLLTERPILEGLIGTGWGSQEKNYRSGYLINDNFFAVDNQFTTVMMACGLVGFVFFCVFVVSTMLRAEPNVRTALFGLIFMFLSFDVLMWAASASLFITLAVADSRTGTLAPAVDVSAASIDSRI